MAKFTKNQREDPYKGFKFRLYFEGNGTPVAAISKVSPLKRTTEVISHRDGGDPSTPHHSPGASKFEPITLERGVTHDPDFENWANLVYSTNGDAAISLRDYKKNLLLEVLNLQGTVVIAYHIFRCWVSEYTAVAELDANSNTTLIQMIVVQNQGWERDLAVIEPTET